jgi:hypothetical protein
MSRAWVSIQMVLNTRRDPRVCSATLRECSVYSSVGRSVVAVAKSLSAPLAVAAVNLAHLCKVLHRHAMIHLFAYPLLMPWPSWPRRRPSAFPGRRSGRFGGTGRGALAEALSPNPPSTRAPQGFDGTWSALSALASLALLAVLADSPWGRHPSCSCDGWSSPW